MTERKLVGGYRGYQEAARDVFESKCMDPAIRYNPEQGFYVESELLPTTDGDVSLGQAFYNLNQDGARSEGGHRCYLIAKGKIIRELDGENAEFDFMEKHRDVFFPDI